MENAEIAKLIKKRRSSTFGATPQAGTPIKRPVPTPPVKRTEPVVQVEAPKAAPVETKAVEAQKSEIVKGFVVGLTKDGKLTLEYAGETPNYLELIALFDYTNVRKREIVEQLANVGTVATRQHVAQLTSTVSTLANGLSGLVEELVHLNSKVDTLYATFVPDEETYEGSAN